MESLWNLIVGVLAFILVMVLPYLFTILLLVFGVVLTLAGVKCFRSESLAYDGHIHFEGRSARMMGAFFIFWGIVIVILPFYHLGSLALSLLF